MKLTPSFDLFQLLPEAEGGEVPHTVAGNELRDGDVLKVGIPDTLWDMKLSDYRGLGGTKKIEALPDPFGMVEEELQPFSDSIKELVSTDQPILSMAAKHFFEKRHGKRFRPTIVQLVAKAVAAAAPEIESSSHDTSRSHSSADFMEEDRSIFRKIGGVSGWQWSGASKI